MKSSTTELKHLSAEIHTLYEKAKIGDERSTARFMYLEMTKYHEETLKVMRKIEARMEASEEKNEGRHLEIRRGFASVDGKITFMKASLSDECIDDLTVSRVDHGRRAALEDTKGVC